VTPELERLLSAHLDDDLDRRPVGELRALSRRAQEWETAVSLTRRLAQGRLDMLRYEARRRAGAAEDRDAALLFDLPDILAESSGGTTGRALALDAPDECADALIALLDGTAQQDDVCRPEQLADDQLAALVGDLSELEHRLSDVRRGLHLRLDALHDEIGRRYRDGEVSIETLLR
jgi:hypothetical protein